MDYHFEQDKLWDCDTIKQLAIRSSTDGFQPKFFSADRSTFIKLQANMSGIVMKDWLVEILACEICKHWNNNTIIYLILENGVSTFFIPYHTPLFEFCIQNKELVSYKDLSGGELWPLEPKVYGMSYRSLNEFFNRRVVKDHAMLLAPYLKKMGLDHYDFDELIKRNNGSTHDFYWVRFDGIGAQCFDDIVNQQYPIYT